MGNINYDHIQLPFLPLSLGANINVQEYKTAAPANWKRETLHPFSLRRF